MTPNIAAPSSSPTAHPNAGDEVEPTLAGEAPARPPASDISDDEDRWACHHAEAQRDRRESLAMLESPWGWEP